MGAVAHQFGFADQSVYETPTTPVTRFSEFVSESLKRRPIYKDREGIRPGIKLGSASVEVGHDAAGDVNFEAPTTGFGLFLETLLGDVATTSLGGSPAAFRHDFTSGSILGKFLTLQKGVEKSDGTVQPFTYVGAKIARATFSSALDDVLKVAVEFDCRDERDDIGLATFTAPATKLFTYAQGSISIEGTPIATVVSLDDLTIVNNLVQRKFMDGTPLKSEPRNRPRDTISGTITAEFANLTDFYDRWTDNTSVEIVLEWEGDVISGANNELLRFTLGDARIRGDSPTVSGFDLVNVQVPFSAFDPASGEAILVEYVTTDATP